MRNILLAVLAVLVATQVYAAGSARPDRAGAPRIEVVEPSDAAVAITWALTGADTTTIANMTTATAAVKVIKNRQWVYVSARMAGATDTIEVTPIFRGDDGATIRVGDTQTIGVATAAALIDENADYCTDTAYWETCGEYDVILHLSVTSGTLQTVWIGTR